ncbi:MAG: RNA polymerase sigma-70 factor [Bacteroidota bacterium]
MKETFKQIYHQYFDAIRSYLYYRSGDADLATDLTQDVFIKIWEKQMEIDLKHIKSLLYKIAGDLFVSYCRRQKLSENYAKTIPLALVSKTEPDAQLEYQELKANYEYKLAQLPEKRRVVFLMSRMDALTYKEIAERLGISTKAVEKRMSLALNDLRTIMQKT